MIEKARASLQLLSNCERGACVLAFSVLATILFLDVAGRTLFGNGITWSHQTAVYANIVIAMMGIGLASRSAAHLRPRFADHLLPRTFDPLLNHLQPLLTGLVLLAFAALATQFVYESWQLQERSTVLQNLLWPIQALVPLAFTLSGVRYLLYAVYPALQADSQVPAE